VPAAIDDFMKRVIQHPDRKISGRRYWRSVDDLADTPEFRQWLEREFPQGAAEIEMDPVSRRNFLRLMGASMTLAGFGFAGCRRPESYIVPHSKGVEWMIPGKGLIYSTAMPRPGGGLPLLVTTHDGRPTKIEGNPLHPESNGGTDNIAQAAVLDLYDPDRARAFLKDGSPVDVAEFESFLQQRVAEMGTAGGARTAVLATADSSPTRDRLRRMLAEKFPAMTWAEYEPLDPGYRRGALNAAFGPAVSVEAKIDAADVILSLDCDFLGAEPNQGGYLFTSKQFSSRRRVSPSGESNLNRLYVVEPVFTTTGGMADHRLPCPAGKIPAFLAELAAAIGAAAGGDATLSSVAATAAQAGGDLDKAWIAGVAADLVAHRGTSLVLVGSRQSPEVQSLALAINNALGNLNKTIVGRTLGQPAPTASLADLVTKIQAGAIDTLFILGGNPALNAPSDVDWPKVQGSVKTVVRLGYYFDETSQSSQWHVPSTHFLESWGDVRTPGGVYSIVQPMILPLFGGWSELDILARLAGLAGVAQGTFDALTLVQDTFKELFAPANFDTAWTLCLRDGFLDKSAPGAMPLTFTAATAPPAGPSDATPPATPSADSFEVVLLPDPNLYDGRYANNGWLQELPDPITKVTWDNAAVMSPATASSLGVKDDELVKIEANGRALTLPVMIAPGTAKNVIGVALGYGIKDASRRVANGAGENASVLLTASSPYIVANVKVTKAGGSRALANTQEHNSMEGRDHVREGTIERFKNEPAFAKTMSIDGHIPPNISLYKSPKMTAVHQWGMTIDLNVCTGCNTCTIACQAENNIPIVGKEQVINGREMQWIRIDRYFASETPDEPNPEMVMQPVPCMHCENAPCETVCPVNATVHNEEGLNVMVYNRCIGTRYCANNCPFKVRRFNYFDYNKRKIQPVDIGLGMKLGNLYLGPLGEEQQDEMVKMQKNPNVTVRMRGVIEKCTFCVQRLEDAKIAFKVRNKGTNNIKLPTDTVKTACQQACPTGAIAFGDISDSQSLVAQHKASDRNYRLLEYLNVQPRVSYLARLKNPNPAMPGAEKVANYNKGGHHAPHGATDNNHTEDAQAHPAPEHH
jgi:molybdopterin-containing oxidoreductase family iron-sulfur binding subunit